MQRRIILLFLFIVCFFITGCSITHKVQVTPVEIKPIHIIIDVNVKVDKALDNFFGDIDKTENKIKE